MPIVNRFAEMFAEISGWRRAIHQHPELGFDVETTAGFVAGRLAEFGCDEVVTGIGRTGVVGLIHGRARASGHVIGLRADMDALPIVEETGKPWASRVAGKMHACGHDGHTAMLLGAARYLCETRHFDGTVAVIFQPAEEGGGGGREMVADGLMERFAIQSVYGMHNMPGLPIGHFSIRSGPLMAAADVITITVHGKGGHAAWPHGCIDPVMIGAHIVTAIQSIVARTIDPLDSAVISITTFHAGEADNVIAERAHLSGTVRTLNPATRAAIETRIRDVVESVARAHGGSATLDYRHGYPVTFNHERQTNFAIDVARSVAGLDRIDADIRPIMGAEDFAYMLEARPGAMIFLGNGDSAGLHHPAYDFNDEIIPLGCSYWVRLVETAMPLLP